MSSDPVPNLGAISGRALRLARAGWMIFAVFVFGLFVAAIPARYQQLVTVSPEAATSVGQLRPAEAEAVARLGLSVGGYAAFLTDMETGTVAIFFAVAALIFVVRSRDGLALLASTTLILVGVSLPVLTALETNGAAWHGLLLVLRAAAVGSFPLLLFLFPDGRFVPRWIRWLAGAWGVYTLAALIWPALQAPMSFGRALRPAEVTWIIWDMAWFGAGTLSQVYRYNRVATLTQRQQTKWVVFGFAIFVIFGGAGLALLIALPFDPRNSLTVFARLAGPTLILTGVLAIPLAIGISILRFRLWDIDIIVRRTLVYSVLTGLLAAVYFGSVVALQNIFGTLAGQRESPLVTVISTLAIAALFVPLRRRVQAIIDRRLYRRHYDAARTLAAFGSNLRDEVEIEALTERLLDVVDETMQPDSATLWIKPAEGGRLSR